MCTYLCTDVWPVTCNVSGHKLYIAGPWRGEWVTIWPSEVF